MVELSAAVERVLDAARLLAGECGSAAVLPVHLLHALVNDESRAHGVLMAAGCTLDDLHAQFPLQRTKERYDPSEAVDTQAVDAVLRQARRWVRETPGESDIQTEHLLAALAEADSGVSALFERFGLTPDGVRGAPTSDASEPIVIEEAGVSEVRDQRSKVRSSITDLRSLTSDLRLPTSDLRPLTSDLRIADHAVLRILDAAANRGREGLRVVEDAARFLLNDAHLCGLLKSLRHELAGALARLGGEMFHVKRDTAGDVGTTITTPREQSRATTSDVLRANCKRVEESLRTLEEYGKLIDPEAAADIEQLRYRFYTLEKSLLITDTSRSRLANCRLYLLVTESACRGGIERVVKNALEGGVDAVQLREKEGDDRRLLVLAEQMRRWTTDAGVLFIVNDRPDIAVLSSADGVHVGQDDLTVAQARRIIGSDQLVGVSTHTVEQARQAVLDGADYLGVGPTFASQTKQFESFAGLEFVRAASAEIGLPWFAIGGISAANAERVVEAGATRVAVSSVICAAEEPQSVASELRGRLQIAN
jgi:thiamine-phosphate pyrophosphorylase